MIVLNPLGGSNVRVIEANGLKDYDINYKFASYLGKYLLLRKEPFAITRSTSERQTDLELQRFMANNDPHVIINIKCLEDLSTDPSGYIVDCDKYSALAATFALELHKWGLKPVYPIGYKVQSFSTSAKYTEITIGLGYITNTSDAIHLGNDKKLEDLAKAMMDAAYGPPTKVMQPKDDVTVPDPYFYSVDKWMEDSTTKVDGDSGDIGNTTIENIPAKVLTLKTPTTARTDPYRWCTELASPTAGKAYTVIISAKSDKIPTKAYVELGGHKEELELLDSTWRRVTFDCTYARGDKLYLGAMDSSELQYTAAWVTPKGTIGKIDSPATEYSIFPPGYRPTTEIDPTNLDKELVPSVVTQANTLMGRALDNKEPETGNKIQQALSKADQSSVSPTAFIDSLQAIMGQFAKLDLKNINILDPTKIKVDYSMMENILRNMSRMDKRADMLKAINNIKGVEKAVKSQTRTYEQKLEDAKKQSAKIQKRLEAKGEALKKK